ncbi:protein phosphatase [Lithospermum erythrorhizon]|uniref:Protein phosphatase n=1 Tax=Lithospermum erythrorhizon TaxID=34254 RepID=A0AAV3NQ52_LITER
MELYGHEAAKSGSPPEWSSAGLETESLQGMSLWGREAYPERPGMPDCAYYMRTGVCGYGAKCRYNHPHDRSHVEGAVQSRVGEYPERVGEPTCQYYIRTGTCKFGALCKFDHPRNAGGSFNVGPLNVYGYPLRPDEKECPYYLQTGQCKFGKTCKFHHPQPAGMSSPAAARPFYPAMQNLPSPSAEQHGGPSTSYRVARPPALSGSYVPGYSPMLYHPGVVPFPNWSSYPGPLTPGAQAAAREASSYGMSQLATSASLPGTYPPFMSYAGHSGSTQKEQPYPIRVGQRECQYYMKTGDCKFGSSCRYHHPPEVLASKTNCLLSPKGLPLRPGVQSCRFYMQKGHCKFGSACKYDHPM